MVMRYLAITAILAFVPVFAQQPGPASGVLVPQAPPAFHQAVRGMVRGSLVPTAGSVPSRPQIQAPKVCAIPLLEAPAKDHIDDGIFLKQGTVSVDSTMVVTPAVPACR